jgi:hypothetical protein
MRHILFAGAAVVALAGGVVTAQAATKAEEDAITRQLNLDQLAKAKSGANTTMPSTPDAREGQGGPELQGPPKPDEGMSDDQTMPSDDTTAPEQAPTGEEPAAPPAEGTPPAEETQPSTQPLPTPTPE